MKLIITIVQDEDAGALIEDLTDNRFRVTKLATTGGFLKAGNTTLLIGAESEDVDKIIGIIKENCESRKEILPPAPSMAATTGVFLSYPLEVNVGGATVFVLDVEKHAKL